MENNTQTDNNEILIDPMSPAETAEWLAVHSLASTQDEYTHPSDEIYYLGHLASNGNIRAVAQLEEMIDRPVTSMSAASALALLSGDAKYLDVVFETVVQDVRHAELVGESFNRNYQAGAEKAALRGFDTLCDTAREIGAEEHVKEIISGRINQNLIEYTLAALSKGRVPDEQKTQFTIKLSEGDEQIIDSLVNEIRTDPKGFDAVLSSVESLETKAARLVAYNRIAQTLKEQASNQI